MTAQRESFGSWLLKSPLLWGGVLTFAFYAAIQNGWITNPQVVRYFASHPVEYVITAMFAVGFAAMLIKFFEVGNDRSVLQQQVSPLGETPLARLPVSACRYDLECVANFAKKHGNSAYTQRLAAALGFIERSGNGGGMGDLDQELRYLADEGSMRQENSYALVRMILWAVPMLGFLGTVVGITLALGNLDLTAIQESSQKLSAGLSVAFDTTALAIALDIFLYFVQFAIQRMETQYADAVEERVATELRGRYECEPATGRSEVAGVRKTLEAMSRHLESILMTQSEAWGRAAGDLTERTSQLAIHAAEQIRQVLVAILNDADSTLAARLQNSVTTSLDAVENLQANAIRQTEMLSTLTGTTRDLIGLEEQIHASLNAIAHTGKLEETVNALAAVIHLLNGKLVVAPRTKLGAA
ncbi:MAG: MotA/TolQ/ExbB proton channel family protein [Thermoguttaceae bacterium]